MKCKACNTELNEGQLFCTNCGAKVEAEEPATEVVEIPAEEATDIPAQETVVIDVPDETAKKEEKGKKNSLLGLIFGIISFVICCIGLPFGIAGIVNSAKGLKAGVRKGMAIPGLILSILGTISGSVWFLYILFVVVMAVIGVIFGTASGVQSNYYY